MLKKLSYQTTELEFVDKTKRDCFASNKMIKFLK